MVEPTKSCLNKDGAATPTESSMHHDYRSNENTYQGDENVPEFANPQYGVESAAITVAYRLQRPNWKTLEMGYGPIWKNKEKVDQKFAMEKDHITSICFLDDTH